MMRYIYLMALCLLIGLASSAIADTIIYSTDIDETDVGGGSTVYLPQFDPALGTLTGVELYLEADAYAGTITWDNESCSPTHVKLGIGAEVTAVGPNSLTIIIIPLQQDEDDVDADNEAGGAPADFVGTDAFTLSGNPGSASSSNTATNVTPYIGTGSFPVNLSSVVETSTSTSGGTGESTSTAGKYDGTVKVTYTYVPEPATMALVSVGGGLLLLRRKRR